MRTDTGLTELYAEAARVTARGSRSFYFATRFFPAPLARAAHAVYSFCRYTDDLVDEAPTPAQGRRGLDEWEHLVRRALDGEPASDPVLAPFQDTVRRCGIPAEYPLDLLAGVRMDLDGVRYQTFADLQVFCYRVASVVGLMMMHVIGFKEPAPAYAADLGVAMQLTNILRDIGEDLRRGRIYLPRYDLHRFGYTEEELRAHVRNDSFRRLMRFQVERARHYYAQAEPGIALLSPEGRFAVQVAARVYRGILDEIERMDYHVFDRRAVVPAAKMYWITAQCMAGPVMRQSARRLVFWRQRA